MKIVESVCGECGAKDTLFPVPEEDGSTQWRCENCGGVFEEENGDEDEDEDQDVDG